MNVNYNLFFTHNISLTSFANVINEQKPFLPNIRKSSDKALLIHVVFCTFFLKKKKVWFEFCHWLKQRLYLHKVWIIKTMVDQCSDYFDSCIVVCLITTSQNCQQEYSRRYIQNKASFVMERGKLTSWKRALCSNQSQPLLIALPWYTRYIIMA